MSKHSLIENIRKEVIKANPSILDLVFGCKVETNIYPSYPITFIVVNKQYKTDVLICIAQNEDDDLRFISKNDVSILGRTIGIADVLLAIRKIPNRNERNKLDFGMNTDTLWIGNTISHSSMDWDLKNDNLEFQSEETLKFINNLLT